MSEKEDDGGERIKDADEAEIAHHFLPLQSVTLSCGWIELFLSH